MLLAHTFAKGFCRVATLAWQSTVSRRAVGTLNDTPMEFKVELNEPEPKLFPSVPVGTETFNLERFTLVSRTGPRRR